MEGGGHVPMIDTLASSSSHSSPPQPTRQHSWPDRSLPTSAHLAVFTSVALPTTALVLAFSVTGYGDRTYNILVALEQPLPSSLDITLLFFISSA